MSRTYLMLLLFGLLAISARIVQAVPPEFKARNDIDFKAKFPYRPVEKWLGERFIFHEELPSQRAGYLYYRRADDSAVGLTTYEELAGKIAKVTSIEEKNVPWLTLTLEENGRQYKTPVLRYFIDRVSSFTDISQARDLLVGKTLAYTGAPVKKFGDANNDEITLPQYCMVKVTDVRANNSEYYPVRIQFEVASGLKCFVDLRLSDTNISPFYRNGKSPEIPFLTYDPRKVYEWPPEIWKAIEDRQVVIGMKDLQARAAIGEPDHEEATPGGFAWTYKVDGGRRVITFVKGAVASVETLPDTPLFERDIVVLKQSFQFTTKGEYPRSLVGELKNESRFHYYANIKVRFLDKDKNRVGVGEATKFDFAPRGSWKFEIGAPPEAATFEVVEVRGTGTPDRGLE